MDEPHKAEVVATPSTIAKEVRPICNSEATVKDHTVVASNKFMTWSHNRPPVPLHPGVIQGPMFC